VAAVEQVLTSQQRLLPLEEQVAVEQVKVVDLVLTVAQVL
tara:strand:+ start:428 stop:547 length:120 start_codon:yes stop_codon:yes gene_type:complete